MSVFTPAAFGDLDLFDVRHARVENERRTGCYRREANEVGIVATVDRLTDRMLGRICDDERIVAVTAAQYIVPVEPGDLIVGIGADDRLGLDVPSSSLNCTPFWATSRPDRLYEPFAPVGLKNELGFPSVPAVPLGS